MICTKTKPIWQITSDYTIHWIFWTCSIHTRTVPLSDYYIGSNTLDNMCNAIMCIDGRALDVRLDIYHCFQPQKRWFFRPCLGFFWWWKVHPIGVKAPKKECNFYQEKQSFKTQKTVKSTKHDLVMANHYKNENDITSSHLTSVT